MEVFNMKKLLLLGALLSTVAMAQVVEVRVGKLTSGSFHYTSSHAWILF